MLLDRVNTIPLLADKMYTTRSNGNDGSTPRREHQPAAPNRSLDLRSQSSERASPHGHLQWQDLPNAAEEVIIRGRKDGTLRVFRLIWSFPLFRFATKTRILLRLT